MRLFNTKNNTPLKPLRKSETELSLFLAEYWAMLFPQFTFITREFKLDGQVRSRGTAGRVDILAFNPATRRFVVIELKKDRDKNINDQASDYREFIEDNFAAIYLLALEHHDVVLPKSTLIQREVEVVLVAQAFSQPDVERARKKKESITLIRYGWYEGDLFLLDFLTNEPSDGLEKENSEKILKIKNVIEGKPVTTEVDLYFGVLHESNRLYVLLYNSLGQYGAPEVIVQNSKIKLVSPNGPTFSVIANTGKGGYKALLQINTDLDLSASTLFRVEDRVRPGQKKKGSVGNERYEVFIQNEAQMHAFISEVEKLAK